MDEYISNLEKEISTKKLDDFWIICDGDFKIITKSQVEIIKTLKEKADKYKNKKIAHIQLHINTNGLNSDSWIFSIKIIIYPIDINGQIDLSMENTWGLYLKYNKHELLTNKFKIGYLEKLLKKVTAKKVTSNLLFGVYYSSI